MDEVNTVLEIIREQLQEQISKEYGIAIFEIHIQNGKIVNLKRSEQTSKRFGS